MIDGQTSELKLLPWTWEIVAESCANTLDSGPGLSQVVSLTLGVGD